MNPTGPPPLLLSMPHECGYLPGRVAHTLFVDPRFPLTTELLGDFNRRGYRRSGDLIYRPHCRHCQACIPVRIPIAEFRMTRSQRRNVKCNRAITVAAVAPIFHAEHYQLFLRYQRYRHPGGTMSHPDPATYMRFLVGRQIQTTFHEFRLDGQLLAVAVIDTLPDGLSAVYTFYEPALRTRGLGTYAILVQIALTRELNLPYLYLGYWIEASPKMAYKSRFQPLQAYQHGCWSPLAAHIHGLRKNS